MSRKTVNAKNLEALGTERLAALMLELCAGHSEVKRRVRLELVHAAGAGALAHEIRKRLATVGRSRGRLDWSKCKAYLADLATQLDLISDRVAREAPVEAFELVWQFLALSPSVFDRLEDRHDALDALCDTAREMLGEIAPRAGMDPEGLADRVFEAISEDDAGAWSELILHLGPALGEAGCLRMLDRMAGLAGPSARRVSLWRRQIADVRGDVDAYLAELRPEDLQRPGAAAGAAERLMEAGRFEAALKLLEDARGNMPAGVGHVEWDAAYVAVLEALGHVEALQAYCWSCFTTDLSVPHLRDHLKRLPDFDDIEQEDAAKALALRHPDLELALVFFLEWPDLAMAAQLVLSRAEDLDGDRYDLLSPAADALEAEHPLASILCRRAMILWTLQRERASRYGYAARHLRTCEHVDAVLADYEGHGDHAAFLRTLRHAHGRKQAFWRRVK